jgi:hypothetical protein
MGRVEEGKSVGNEFVAWGWDDVSEGGEGGVKVCITTRDKPMDCAESVPCLDGVKEMGYSSRIIQHWVLHALISS